MQGLEYGDFVGNLHESWPSQLFERPYFGPLSRAVTPPPSKHEWIEKDSSSGNSKGTFPGLGYYSNIILPCCERQKKTLRRQNHCIRHPDIRQTEKRSRHRIYQQASSSVHYYATSLEDDRYLLFNYHLVVFHA